MNLFVSMIGLAFGAATVSAAPKTAEKMSPAEAVLDMSPGWNLGNALDSIPNEDSWNNKPTRQSTIQAIKKAGFRSIRLPVTWTHHTGPAPDYRIDETWMTRVEEIVDWALEEDLWVFLDVHHDSW
jgi:endoglucanase